MPKRAVCWIVLAALLGALPGCLSAPVDPNRPFAGQELRVFNWSDYIDPALIDEFQRRTGAHVQYDNYSTESELETKLLTGGGGYDVVFPSDHGMTTLVRTDLLQPLDQRRLPNFEHLDQRFLQPPYDPDNRFSVPYCWGTLAVGIRSDHVEQPVNGFDVLFDERYKGRITMLDDAENTVAAVMLYLGHPMNSTDPAHLEEARQALLRQRPLVQAYTSDGYKEKLIKGEAWVALGWSGDILQAARENANVQAVIPASGTMVWVDNIAIPRGAQHVELAHVFIDFLLEPEIAARNANFVRYPTPNRDARPLLSEEMQSDPAVNLPPAVLDKCERLQNRGAAITAIEQVWRQVRR